MNITDVPVSGKYVQAGAITQLVVQLIDPDTLLPINIGAATDLTLTLEYPDGTVRSFSAGLYTDGSDGMLSYTTHNDGASDIDLIQSGLYQIQGQATIGGVLLPPSEVSNFYARPNLTAPGALPIPYTSSAIISFDANNVRWAMTVDTLGALHWTARLSGPINSLTLNAWVMKDSDGVYWTIQADGSGSYVATVGGTYAQAVGNLVVLDSASHAWVLTISTAGVLTPT